MWEEYEESVSGWLFVVLRANWGPWPGGGGGLSQNSRLFIITHVYNLRLLFIGIGTMMGNIGTYYVMKTTHAGHYKLLIKKFVALPKYNFDTGFIV